MAKEKAVKAAAKMKAAEAQAESFKAAAEAAKKKAAEEQATAEAAAKAAAEALEKAKLENIKALKEAAEKQKAAQEAANKAATEAHQQAVAARKLQSEQQEADHKKKMAERKAKFKDQFEHVWVSGPTGISIVEMTLPDSNSADLLIDGLFYDNMIADVENMNYGMSRSFLRGGKIVTEDGEQKLIMTTSDERLEEVMAYVKDKVPNLKHDLITLTPATGNKIYINWVKEQTITREAAEKKAKESAEA